MGENGHAGQLKIITQTFGSFGCGVVWDAGKAGAKTAFEWIFASRRALLPAANFYGPLLHHLYALQGTVWQGSAFDDAA